MYSIIGVMSRRVFLLSEMTENRKFVTLHRVAGVAEERVNEVRGAVVNSPHCKVIDNAVRTPGEDADAVGRR
jgi:hypothetical protein